jgi:hypothetical protein
MEESIAKADKEEEKGKKKEDDKGETEEKDKDNAGIHTMQYADYT